MLTKCIGIISYFPDNQIIRGERIKRFEKLLNCLNSYFNLPVIIIAQNWKEYQLPAYCNTVHLYKYNNGLGITKARIILREKLLKLDYNYFIFLDDDSDIVCSQKSVDNYLREIDSHPDMVGKFFNSWPRLLAISKPMLKIMDYDYIKNYEAHRGEIWEDMAYIKTYEKLYPNKFFKFSKTGISEISPVSKKDTSSTWYNKKFGDEREISRKTKDIIERWYRSKRNV